MPSGIVELFRLRQPGYRFKRIGIISTVEFLEHYRNELGDDAQSIDPADSFIGVRHADGASLRRLRQTAESEAM